MTESGRVSGGLGVTHAGQAGNLLPGYWQNETSGVLRPVIEAYLLTDAPLAPDQVAVFRSYLRQWMATDRWKGPMITMLRRMVDELRTRQDIDGWLAMAEREAIDPL
jgi:hypothetical protein